MNWNVITIVLPDFKLQNEHCHWFIIKIWQMWKEWVILPVRGCYNLFFSYTKGVWSWLTDPFVHIIQLENVSVLTSA